MDYKRTFCILILTMIGLILSSACIWPAVSAASSLSESVTQTWEALNAFGQQATEESPEPSDESQADEEPTPTATPTPGPPLIHVSVDTNCRSGPGLIYAYLGALMTYDEAEILARSSLPGYWVIDNPDQPGTECWVGEQYASIVGDTSGLPVRTPPPTPTPEEPDILPGSISGYAYIDGNNNGQHGDPQDSGMVGALVWVSEGSCPGSTKLAEVLIDSSGYYIFNDLPPGNYCVKRLYLPQPTIPLSHDLVLNPGENLQEINFRYIP